MRHSAPKQKLDDIRRQKGIEIKKQESTEPLNDVHENSDDSEKVNE